MNNIQLYNDDCINILRQLPDNSIDTVITDPPAGISFMNKKWDDDKGGRDNWINWLSGVMKECLRVTKPGGTLTCWAIPRTSHWTGMAIESAGWEVRDVVTHIFGNGFPKSLDISKQVDKIIGGKRVITGVRYTRGKNKIYGAGNGTNNVTYNTMPASDEAKLWDGYGTALKPACEFYWLAMKPLDGTFAENALKWGVAGLAIDKCRIEWDEAGLKGDMNRRKTPRTDITNNSYGKVAGSKPGMYSGDENSPSGRWPANLILDEESAKLVDEQSDKNNTSRFFYCAKASKKEREEGLENSSIANKSGGVLGFRQDGSLDGKVTEQRMNIHPTVKPISLMRYLCKLTSTPTNGVVLDPFMGSGTTGIAATLENRDFIGIEMDSEYFEIAKLRIGNYAKYSDLDIVEDCKEKQAYEQGDMFSIL